MPMGFASQVFDQGDHLPKRYVRGGENISPPLHWWDAPAGTRSFAVLMEDPDAPKGTFRHWGFHDIPRSYLDLPEAAGRYGQATGRHGVNDFGEPRYDGPEPPIGKGPHRYVFRLYALNVSKLDAPHSASVAQVFEAARSHVIAEAEIMGLYER